jgi:hypothetical protein
MRRVKFCSVATVIVGLLAMNVSSQAVEAQDVPAQDVLTQDVSAQDGSTGLRCKRIHGDLVEAQTTVGCKPEHTSCFLGEVDANHGLRGTTYFKGDANSGVTYPTAPTFRGYTGNFEYITARGTLLMKEMGMIEPFTAGNPQSGVVNAYQRVVGGTDEFEGATGYLFVSGFNRNQRVVTTLHGVICKAPHGH